VTWALLNQALLSEAKGKGHVVQRMLLHRMGARLRGNELMTRTQLREMIENEETSRVIVHQLMKVGRDVRSTPMYWAYEGKKTDCLMKHLSWRPPWVREPGAVPENDLLSGSSAVDDVVGLGRSAAFWGTLNCGYRGYNNVYDIHRLDVGAQCAAEAVKSPEDMYKSVRTNFVRNAPDLVTFQIALRTELIMKVVLPTIVPSSEEHPFMPVGRFETGPSTGNPHTHLFAVGTGNEVFDSDGTDGGSAAGETEDAKTETTVAVGDSEPAPARSGEKEADADMTCQPCGWDGSGLCPGESLARW
jgi:hypothetical protein